MIIVQLKKSRYGKWNGKAGLILVMLVTGFFWGTWFTLTRSIGEFSAAEFIHIGKVIIANVAGPMQIPMALSILFLGLSTWMDHRKKSRAFYPILASLGLMVITLLITVLVEVPIDDQIKIWTAMTIPGDWKPLGTNGPGIMVYGPLPP